MSHARSLGALVAVLLLAGCSGADGGGSESGSAAALASAAETVTTAPAPEPSLTIDPSQALAMIRSASPELTAASDADVDAVAEDACDAYREHIAQGESGADAFSALTGAFVQRGWSEDQATTTVGTSLLLHCSDLVGVIAP